MTKQCGIANYRRVMVGDLGNFSSIEPFDGLLSRPMSIDLSAGLWRLSAPRFCRNHGIDSTGGLRAIISEDSDKCYPA
jgi:hypothetical protein